MKRGIFLCDGAETLPAGAPTPDLIEQLDHRGNSANFTLDDGSDLGSIISAGNDRWTDLVRLGGYALTADQCFSRGALDPYGDEWKRSIHLVLPVHDLKFWQTPQVMDALRGVLEFLSGDRWSFSFSQASSETYQATFIRDED
jgi:hypothetical protein